MNIYPRQSFLTLLFALLCWHVSGQAPRDDQDKFALSFRVEAASDWTEGLNRSSGWIGGDGLFSIPRRAADTIGGWQATETLLVFSDSFWGSKSQGKLAPGARMTNNVVATLPAGTLDADRLTFYSGPTHNGQPTSVFIPATPNAKEGQYYWLGDGFVNPEIDSTTYIFAYRMENTGEAVFGFREAGNVLLAIDADDRPPFPEHRQIETPLYIAADKSTHGAGYSFGAGVMANTSWAGAPHPDGFMYVYGVRGPAKELLVARVKPADFENFSRWEYWDGAAWQPDIQNAVATTNHVSNELSVMPLADGRYLLVFQINGIEPRIGVRVGLSPVGPFGPVVPIYECPEPLAVKSLYAYNAKAHPHLSKPGELLISYHVNSFDFLNDLGKHPDMFSPRFIRLLVE